MGHSPCTAEKLHWNTVDTSTCKQMYISMKISSLKFVQVRYLYSLRRVAIAEKELRPDAQTCGLRSNMFFQPRKPPIRLQLFVSNCPRYGHEWAAMLQTLMTHTLRLDCAAVHSTASYISRAQTRKPEVDGGDWRKKCDWCSNSFPPIAAFLKLCS